MVLGAVVVCCWCWLWCDGLSVLSFPVAAIAQPYWSGYWSGNSGLWYGGGVSGGCVYCLGVSCVCLGVSGVSVVPGVSGVCALFL